METITKTGDRQLLSVSAPMSLAEPMDDTDVAKIRGFMSVELEDRSGDFVPADEFNIKSFMAKPVLMYNHRFWRDAHGNEISIGVVKDMFVASIANIEGDTENYAVVRTDTNEIADTFPKRLAIDMRVGMKGVWAVAEITVPEVAQKVKDGELNAFSWRGLARVGSRELPDGTIQKLLADIDLFELSTVYIPDNPAATFAVGKGFDDTADDLILYSIRLDKTRFETDGMANEYLRLHELDNDGVHEDTSAYYAVQKSLDDFQERSLVAVKIAAGVKAVVGPLKEKSQPIPEGIGTLLEDSLLHQFKQWANLQEPLMSNEDTKASDTMDETVEEATKESPEMSDADQRLLEAIKTAVVAGVAESVPAILSDTMTPTLQGIADTLKSVGDVMRTFAEKQSEVTVETEDAEDGAEAAEDETVATEGDAEDTTADTLKSMADMLKKVTEQQAQTEEQLLSFAKSAQAAMTRDEVIETVEEDPNAVLDSQFPFD